MQNPPGLKLYPNLGTERKRSLQSIADQELEGFGAVHGRHRLASDEIPDFVDHHGEFGSFGEMDCDGGIDAPRSLYVLEPSVLPYNWVSR